MPTVTYCVGGFSLFAPQNHKFRPAIAVVAFLPMTLSAATALAAAACSASILAPSSTAAFVLPLSGDTPISSHHNIPSSSSSAIRYFREGNNDNANAPCYPSTGGGTESSANATVAALDVDTDRSISSNDEADVVGAGTLGDIMAGSGCKYDILTNRHDAATTVVDGLVTKEGGELNARFDVEFTPMERIALTANGNLQRIFSSYYDAPVHVHVDSCARRRNDMRPPRATGFDRGSIDDDNFDPTIHRPEMFMMNVDDAIWDRIVRIQVHDRTICRATSIISVRSPHCIGLIEDGSVGLGQMFR